MNLAHFRMLNNKLLKNDLDVVLEQAHLIVLDSISAVCMANNGKYTKHTRNISRRMHFVINSKECNLQKTVWCEGDLQLADIVTKDVR